MKHRRSSFTLIELLIVVAIIGILAAIAVPNFINAQLRAKITRACSDMETLAKALDMYFIDCNTFPASNYVEHYPIRPFRRLTTPIAYMSSFPQDPFRAAITDAGYPLIRYSGPDYTYWMCDDTDEYDGPNTRAKPSRPGKRVMTFDWFMMSPGPCPTLEWIFYDTSNGVNSLGCIYHSNSKEEKNSGGGNYDHSHGNP